MSAPAGYSIVQIWLHWLTAALILVTYLTADAAEDALEAASGGILAGAHVYGGMIVMGFVALRLIFRAARGTPELPEVGNSALIETASKWTHWALYGLLALVPLTGMMVWYLGLDFAGGLHELLFNGLLAVVVLHTLAALFHHYILRDGLITRMMKSG